MPERDEIVRNDFPVVRQGYDRDTVDAHLQWLAESVRDLNPPPQSSSLAAIAGEKVMDIIDLVERTAAEIVEQADHEAEELVERAEATLGEQVQRANGALGQVISEAETMRESVRSVGQRIEEEIRSGVKELNKPREVPIETAAPGPTEPTEPNAPNGPGGPKAAASEPQPKKPVDLAEEAGGGADDDPPEPG